MSDLYSERPPCASGQLAQIPKSSLLSLEEGLLSPPFSCEETEAQVG